MSEQLARLFHETYERLAPTFGYETRKGTAVPWEQVPTRNKNLMIAVADVVEMQFFGGAANGESKDDLLGNEFFAQSGFGHNTQRPFVALSYNGRKIAQMFPEDAIALAHNLLAVAEASLGDAFLIGFLHTRVGAADHEIAGIIAEFREWRDKREESQEP
jgi:hypothetical protein